VDAEDLLSAVESSYYGDPGEAMGALAEAVAAINREMGDEKRIRRLVTCLQRAAASVAAQSGASGFSISVGLPLAVSVSVQWEHR
jgi:hypothetical protein